MEKTYRVSMAMVRPMNYEVRDILASSEREAFELALEAWISGTGSVEDSGYDSDDMLNLNGDMVISPDADDYPATSIPDGVLVEEQSECKCYRMGFHDGSGGRECECECHD